MKIFVTGGTGFIGSHFINEAHSRGITVVALRRSGSLPRVKLIEEPIWVDGQLDNFDDKYLHGCESIVHLAAHTPNPPYDSYGNCFYWNVVATLNLFDKARKKGVSNFLVAGTCFEYGKSGERYEYIPTTAPLEPTSSYPASKVATSIALSAWSVENKVKVKILRIFQVFGEGELDSRLWPSLKFAAENGTDLEMTEGEQVRDFVPVQEVATKFVEELNFFNMKENSFLVKNVGSGKPQSIRDFAEFWWKKLGATGVLKFGELPYRDEEIMRYVPEI
jgi:nucleoside-diphosphate-sugar epimerase